jgi:putative molybdopterin biosynthesis protein
MTPLMTLQEAAKVLQVSYFRCCELARRDLLPVVRLGRQYRIDPRKLEQFIDSGGRALPGGWRRRPPDGQQAEAARQ